LSKKLNLTVSTTGYKIYINNIINAGAMNIKALSEDSLEYFFEKKSNNKLDK